MKKFFFERKHHLADVMWVAVAIDITESFGVIASMATVFAGLLVLDYFTPKEFK